MNWEKDRAKTVTMETSYSKHHPEAEEASFKILE